MQKAWKVVNDDYKLIKKLSARSETNTEVILAKNRKTKVKVAIKLIKFQGDIIKYQTKYIFRELQI